MPLYDYWCKKCDLDYKDILRLSSEYDKPFDCEVCNQQCVKKWVAPAMQPDSFHQGFYYPALNQHFTSKSQWEKAMKQRGLAVVEPGMMDKMPSSTKERIDRKHEKRSIETIKKEVAEHLDIKNWDSNVPE